MPEPPFSTPLDPARLVWEDQVPVATDYGDLYFSRHDGMDETRHVFLQGNALPDRLASLSRHQFVIGETGFGTGLNFLCAARCFLEQAPMTARLHYVSVERHPLTRDALTRALGHWPALAPLSQELLEHYPALCPGFHRLALAGGRIRLTLLLGDAAASLAELDARVDAWFLDGFAPSRNPGMWSEDLFRQLARLSAPGATLATFTAAGFVRRGLQQQGFLMRRVPGHGSKREMLTGTGPGTWQPQALSCLRVAVIGAGLAGATTARALAERGHSVTVFDPSGIAAQASGNLAGMLYTTPSAHPTTQNRFYQSSFLHARHWLQRLGFPSVPEDGALQGVIQQPTDERHRERLTLALDSGFWPREQLCPADHGWPPGAVHFPRAGYLSPPRWCRHLMEHAAITLRHQAVTGITPGKEGGWILQLDDQDLSTADRVILANAGAATEFAGLDWLPLKRIRGQVTHCAATDASRGWRLGLCHEGYLTPAINGLHCVGATFDLQRPDLDADPEDDRRNLEQLHAHVPDAWEALGGADIRVHGRRVGLRVQSNDFLPIVGPVPDARRNPSPAMEHLYVNVAHGSRGLSGTPLAAELLAALISAEPLPVDRTLYQALIPERFILRRRRRQPDWHPDL